MDMILRATKVEFDSCEFTQCGSWRLDTVVKALGKDFGRAFKTKNCTFKGVRDR